LGGQTHLRAIARVEPVPISLVASALNLHRPFRSSGQGPRRAGFWPAGVEGPV